MRNFTRFGNLRHLRMVQLIGKVGGISGAAREMHTSQPTVTQALSNVEAEIGTAIFSRSATGTYPTEAGRKFLVRVERCFDILDGAFAQLNLAPSHGQEPGLPRSDRLLSGAQLRALIAVSEPGQLGKACQALGLSESTVLRSVRALERSLDKPLFDRTARGLIPNQAGELLASEFRRAVRELELGHGETALDRGGDEGLEIIVGALPMAGSFELATATAAFMQAAPSVKVKINIAEYDGLLLDLRNSKIDMLFGMLRKPEWASYLAEETLFQDGYCVVVRPGHPLSRLKTIALDELRRYPWIVPSKETPRRKRIEAIFNDGKVCPSFKLETSSLSMSRAMLLRSDAITLATQSEVQADLDLGVLVGLPFPTFEDRIFKGVTTRKDWLPTQAHAQFLACLRQATARGG